MLSGMTFINNKIINKRNSLCESRCVATKANFRKNVEIETKIKRSKSVMSCTPTGLWHMYLRTFYLLSTKKLTDLRTEACSGQMQLINVHRSLVSMIMYHRGHYSIVYGTRWWWSSNMVAQLEHNRGSTV